MDEKGDIVPPQMRGHINLRQRSLYHQAELIAP